MGSNLNTEIISLEVPRGRSEKVWSKREGKEKMEIKVTIMQIYALFFSIFLNVGSFKVFFAFY